MSSSPSKIDPSLEYSLQVLSEAIKYDLNCHRVGKIVKFNPKDLTCDVELLELKPNKGRLDKYALILGLPLIIQGGINSSLTFGDITGCECLVHFNDRDIDSWFTTGEAYKPNSKRLHDFSDGFVSLRPFSSNNLIEYDIDGVVLKKGTSKIKLTDDVIEVNNGKCIISIQGDTINVTGNLVVSGTITSNTDVISGTISGKSHVHTGNMGAPTSAPLP